MSEPGTERLRIIEQMAAEYERGALDRGQGISAANYRNIRKALENLREEIEDSRQQRGGST